MEAKRKEDQWTDEFLAKMEEHPTLRREFADYQCNYFPHELRTNVPKFFIKSVVDGELSEADYEAAIIGVVCQRMKFRRSTIERAHANPELQKPNPKFAKKRRRANNAPSSRAWRANNRELMEKIRESKRRGSSEPSLG